jgi:hypothetical protein
MNQSTTNSSQCVRCVSCTQEQTMKKRVTMKPVVTSLSLHTPVMTPSIPIGSHVLSNNQVVCSNCVTSSFCHRCFSEALPGNSTRYQCNGTTVNYCNKCDEVLSTYGTLGCFKCFTSADGNQKGATECSKLLQETLLNSFEYLKHGASIRDISVALILPYLFEDSAQAEVNYHESCVRMMDLM